MNAGETSFEELYARLEQTAAKLEQGNLTLEEALRLYEEGVALVAQLRAILSKAELRVRQLHDRLAGDETVLREAEFDYEADGP
ncbi:Exodeoxyribonuclease 7 small subunit [bacterium HR29]|nr:Exodeoxyribonuclease 7 small subunit [bacterium HR29]